MAGKGGARPGAGRPTKAKEEQVRRLGLNAIEKVYGSVQSYYEYIAAQSKESFPHLKLLQEYVYGKPKEVVVLENKDDAEELDYSKFSKETLQEIANAQLKK